MGYACEEGLLLEGGVYDSALDETETSSLRKGTFSLRRTHYLNNGWHEKRISQKLCHSLVGIIAKRYIDRGVAFPELIKVGNIGFTYALDNFELEGGLRFSTYAARCIRRHIERVIMDKSFVQSIDKQMELSFSRKIVFQGLT
jgi:DNA-directed RNA polymerase sigma subunit (sigma70/sigma32)